jgi:hypothetical protein
MMPTTPPYVAIYDFGLLPYALGDVLTWNVQTAVRAAEAGRSQVDIYICADPEERAFPTQREPVIEENAFLHLNEMLGAFGTHPFLGDIYIYRSRGRILERLHSLAEDDALLHDSLREYETTARSDDDEIKVSYFRRNIFSHAKLNERYARGGEIPLLGPSRGCESDVEGVATRLLGGKRVVVIHPRLRRLDLGFGDERSYNRDSDFLVWYSFLREAARTHPEAQFVVMGRLQEKPLELLRLNNVTSLRTLGLSLGHELTLLRRADFFIGTSSGFAAMANFCEVPYFITRTTRRSCQAYDIPEGSPSLPFAAPNQFLVYDEETAALLGALLEKGLSLPPRGAPPFGQKRPTEIDPDTFSRSRSEWLYPSALTGRYFTDDDYTDQETAFLIAPHIARADEAVSVGDLRQATEIAHNINDNFPRLSNRYVQLRALESAIAPPLNSRIRARGRIWLRRILARQLKWLLSLDRQLVPKTLQGSVIHSTALKIRNWALGDRR